MSTVTSDGPPISLSACPTRPSPTMIEGQTCAWSTARSACAFLSSPARLEIRFSRFCSDDFFTASFEAADVSLVRGTPTARGAQRAYLLLYPLHVRVQLIAEPGEFLNRPLQVSSGSESSTEAIANPRRGGFAEFCNCRTPRPFRRQVDLLTCRRSAMLPPSSRAWRISTSETFASKSELMYISPEEVLRAAASTLVRARASKLQA